MREGEGLNGMEGNHHVRSQAPAPRRLQKESGSSRQAAGVGGMDWGCLCREVGKAN